MPLSGDYEPSTSDWARENAEQDHGVRRHRRHRLKGKPVILLTTIGAKTGKIRKTPLMRVEHDGRVRDRRVAGRGTGEPGLVLQHQGASAGRTAGRHGDEGLRRPRGVRRREGRVVGACGRGLARTTPSTRRRRTGRSRCSCSRRLTEHRRSSGTIDRCPLN